MIHSVYTSKEGQNIIEQAYRVHLNSSLAQGLTQRFVDTTHGKTFVIEKSESGKPPVILLHGSVSNSASWLGLIPMFAERFSVYCLDIPGEPGLSESERFPLASHAPETWLKSALDGLGIDICLLLGMSLGGWYALNFAITNPDRVAALSLVSAGGIASQKTSFILKALLFMMMGQYGQKRLAKAIYHNVQIPKEIIDYQAIVSKYFRPVTETLPIFTDEQLRALHVPIQYFGGAHDVLLDAKTSVKRLHTLIDNAEAHLITDSGHAIIDKFEEARDFLANHWSD